MENSFLKEFKDREYFNQCTNFEELGQLMNKKKIKEFRKKIDTVQFYSISSYERYIISKN